MVALCGSGGRRPAVRRALRGPAPRPRSCSSTAAPPCWTSLLLSQPSAIAGLLAARLGGRSWVFALTTGGVTLVVALAVVVLKNFLGH